MKSDSQVPNSLPLIIDIEALLPLLAAEHILVVAVCSEEVFRKHHISGSVLIEPAELVCGVKPATGKLPGIEQLNQLFSRIGLSDEKHVIAYDDEGGGWAGRLIWTLDVLGHTHSSFLNGGLVAWLQAQHPVTDGAPEPSATVYNATIDGRVIADLSEVMNQLNNDDTVIWDARANEEYTGTKLTAQKNGHIPGAVNLDWLELMDPSRSLRLKPPSELQALLDSVGISKDKQVITHCQTHHRSGLSYFVAKSLGYEIKAYDGSWSEWGNHPDTPVAT
jgi:thiosulfate/3-mercaptopyruvate sulfurtransferase